MSENQNNNVMPASGVFKKTETTPPPQNTSGLGSNFPVPDAVSKRFNWGAFLLNCIWGIGNNTYITFLIFVAAITYIIPLLGWLICLGMSIWFGIKGNTWAWQNKYFVSVEAFHEYQKKWAIASVIVQVVFYILPLLFLHIILAPSSIG